MNRCIGNMKEQFREEKILVLATTPDSTGRRTGSNVSTQRIVTTLSRFFQVKLVELCGAGKSDLFLKKGFLIAKSIFVFFFTMKEEEPTKLYYVPAASFLGALRDIIFCIGLLTLFRFRNSVIHIHNGNFFFSAGLLYFVQRQFLYSVSEKIIVLDSSLVPEKTWRARPKKFLCLPNSVDMRIERVVDFGIGSRKKVLFVSNFLPGKGLDIFLEAVSLINERESGSEFCFSIIGAAMNDEQREDVLRVVGELKRRGARVQYHGVVTDVQTLGDYYNDSDIFCLPSSYHHEAQPICILEAMANGCAIISTRFRAIPSLVEHGVNGLLMETKEPKELANFIDNLSREEIIRMKIQSRRIFRQRFSSEVYEKALLGIFQ